MATSRTEEPPLYQIDLSLPPESRYTQICEDYKSQIADLIAIYDSLISCTPNPRFTAFLARKLLRNVYSTEETKELKGISKTTGIAMHLVVAFNTFLDLFSGCMSGGVEVGIPRSKGTKIVHFRNLDWEMDPLRKMIIRVEYLREGAVVARAVTYAGYIGVLTGVREGLSISLNYRANIQVKSSNFKQIFHYILLLLGYRQSIASQLRQILLSPVLPTLRELSVHFLRATSSLCYLTFCTPSSILIVEKDLKSAVTHESETFLAVTNHDREMETWNREAWDTLVKKVPAEVSQFVEESKERKECMCNLWRTKEDERVTITDVKDWLKTYPIRNESTHFSCILDPSEPGGGLVWVETWEKGRQNKKVTVIKYD